MKRIVAVTACPTGIAHTLMAAEALKRAAITMGHQIKVETQGSVGTRERLSETEIAAADVVVLAADIHVNETPFAGKPIHTVSTAEAIRNSKAVIEAALALLPPGQVDAGPSVARITHARAPSPVTAETPAISLGGKRLVGITSCPTGIAHTFMAAEALQKSARRSGTRSRSRPRVRLARRINSHPKTSPQPTPS